MRSLEAKQIILNFVRIVMKVINWIGYLSLTGMVLVTSINVFGRYVLNKPLLGEVDMVQLGMAVFGGVAVFIAATRRHHVGVDVLIVRFPRHIQLMLSSFAALLGFLTIGVLALEVFIDGIGTVENGSTTETLLVRVGPFELIFAVFLFLFCLTMLIQVFRPESFEEK